MPNEIYTSMVQPPGAAYRSSQVESWSHYREPIDRTDGRLHGESRRWGDASAEVQSRVIDSLIESSREAGLTPRETAHVLAIARVESGFNPDAAAGTTSASGLGQFIDKTGKHYGLNNGNRFDVDAQSDALVAHFVDNRNLARSRGQGEEYIYKYHHDGPTRDYGGLGLSERKVAPHLDEYEQFVNQRLAQTQGQTQGAQQQQAVPAAAAAAVAAQDKQDPTRSYEHTMNVMLPPQNGVKPHITGHFGEHRGEKAHGGSDFNYVGGQTGRNLQHPTVHAPIAGVVTSVGGRYGTVMIQDTDGNSHQILHLQGIEAKVGQRVEPGDPIGTMGGRGPEGPNQYAQHVHYQMKDPNGNLINPEAYWNKGVQQLEGKHGHAHDHAHDAPAGTLRKGDRSDEVSALQKELNRLGVRDADGKPLAEDGKFGDNTREAVMAFQRQQGLKDDGIVGKQTFAKLEHAQEKSLEQAPAKTGPQLGDKAHPDTELYNAVRGKLPSMMSNDAAALVTAQAKQAGIDSADKLQSVTVQDGRAFVMGTTPGFRAAVDLTQAPPPAEQTSAKLMEGNNAQQQVQSQAQEEQQKVAMGR